jgi:hypothetical protein
VGDAGMKELRELKDLRHLFLDSTKVADPGLEELKHLERLELLDLVNTQVTDAGMKNLKQLQNLRELSLDRTKVADPGLKELKGLEGLEGLYLGHTKITDEGLKELKEFKNLRWVSLRGTQMTDAGLRELKGLKKLKRLNVVDTQVTAAGINELKAALPGVKVVDKDLGPLGNLVPNLPMPVPVPGMWKWELPGWLAWLLGGVGLAALAFGLGHPLGRSRDRRSGDRQSPNKAMQGQIGGAPTPHTNAKKAFSLEGLGDLKNPPPDILERVLRRITQQGYPKK